MRLRAESSQDTQQKHIHSFVHRYLKSVTLRLLVTLSKYRVERLPSTFCRWTKLSLTRFVVVVVFARHFVTLTVGRLNSDLVKIMSTEATAKMRSTRPQSLKLFLSVNFENCPMFRTLTYAAHACLSPPGN